MPRTKTLKQLANDFDVHPKTLGKWLRLKFPLWFKSTQKTMNAKKLGSRHSYKRTYTPKEIKLIYEYYGEPKVD